ncbi:Rab-GTPase-TBC domain [Pelomyxa schiedti]|nr:Rab-GTPase-TBC domain [Pelomyxa schiedti]
MTSADRDELFGRDAYGVAVGDRNRGSWPTAKLANERAIAWRFVAQPIIDLNAVSNVSYQALKSKQVPETILTQIGLDLPRTFTECSFFSGSGRAHVLLRNLLVAFAALHPDIGYTQSLNDIAATALLGCGCFLPIIDERAEECAFWLFDRVANIIGLECYSDHMIGLLVAQGVLEKMLQQHLPSVLTALDTCKIHHSLITTSWVLCCFAHQFSGSILWNLWDRLITAGNVTPIYATCIALLHRAGLEGLDASSAHKCVELCHALPHTLAISDLPAFFREVDKLTLKISTSTLSSMLYETRNAVVADTQMQLSGRQMAALAKATHFTEQELRMLRSQFAAASTSLDSSPSSSSSSSARQQAAPSNLLNFETFCALVHKAAPHWSGNKEVLQTVFDVFDSDGNNYIDFREMMVGLSIMLKGSVTDKLHFIFTVFDLDQSGDITKEELKHVLGEGGLFKLIKKKHPMTLDEYIDKLFLCLDTNRDEKISETEFLQVMKQEPSLVAVFFDPNKSNTVNVSSTPSDNRSGEECCLMIVLLGSRM